MEIDHIAQELVHETSLNTEQSQAVVDTVTDTLASALQSGAAVPVMEDDMLTMSVERESFLGALSERLDLNAPQAAEVLDVLARILPLA